MDIRNLIVYLKLCVKPTLISGIVFSLWVFLWLDDIHISLKDEENMARFFEGVGILYALLAAHVFIIVFRKHQRIMVAVYNNNIDDFLDAAYVHIYAIMHFLIGVVAFVWLTGFLLLNYSSFLLEYQQLSVLLSY